MPNYFFTDAILESVPLTPGSDEHKAICDFLGKPYNITPEEIAQELYTLHDFYFDVKGDRLTNFSGNDDNIMGDPDDLDPVAALFTGWVEYESDGTHFRSLFTDGTIHSGEIEYQFFPVATLDSETIKETIPLVEKYLAELKAKPLA